MIKVGNNAVPFVCLRLPLVTRNGQLDQPPVGRYLPSVKFGPSRLGFTLVELLVTLAIAAILFGLAVPSMARFLQSNRLTTATNTLVSNLQLARSEAIERGVPVMLCKSADGTSCSTSAGVSWANGWLMYADLNGDSAWTAANDVMIRIQEALPADIAVTAPGNVITFNRQGMIGTGPGTGNYQLCSTPLGKSRIVSLGATGRTTLSEGAPC
jgi:type IV fimbrial biogenesis protein FimT